MDVDYDGTKYLSLVLNDEKHERMFDKISCLIRQKKVIQLFIMLNGRKSKSVQMIVCF